MKKTYAALFALLAFAVLAPTSAMADVWGDQINDPTRFAVLPGYGGTAVQDQESGLVWEQSPSTERQTWQTAQSICIGKNVGNRLGWRLPTIQELASLVDPTQSNPRLPAGHPFSNVQSDGYWSATTNSYWGTDTAWAMVFVNPFAGPVGYGKSSTLFAWCVRGGQGVNPQP